MTTRRKAKLKHEPHRWWTLGYDPLDFEANSFAKWTMQTHQHVCRSARVPWNACLTQGWLLQKNNGTKGPPGQKR